MEVGPMRRLLRFLLHAVLVLVAAAVSFMAVGIGGVSPHLAPAVLLNGLMAGALGLILGLIVAWMRGVPWRHLPVILRIMMRRGQQEFWWLVAGTGAAAVLVLY
jgi:hypothetical protein